MSITSTGGDGRTWALYDKAGNPVGINARVKSFRGESAVVIGGKAPHKEGSEGKVWVDWEPGDGEYYPSVFDLRWERVG